MTKQIERMQGRGRILVLLKAGVATVAAFSSAAWAADPEKACRQLFDLSVSDTTILSAGVVDDHDRLLPAPALEYAKTHGLRPEDRPALPDYCRVRGFVRPAINFELRLPLSNWNGKFFMAGCGGFCGEVLPDRIGLSNSINIALSRNYAAVTTDAGHWGENAVDGIWAYNNRAAERDWAWRAIPEVSRAAKEIIAVFYGRSEEFSYFSGCSNGGRMAATATQRFPELFDGVLIGAPALDWRTLVMHGAWTIQSNTDGDGKPILGLTKTQLIADAVMNACDGADGLEDKLISDPRRCRFDPKQLLCKTGEDIETCLTEAETGVLEKWYGGLPNGHGVDWKYNVAYGSEPYWPAWLTPPAGYKGAMELFLEGLFRYILFERDPGPSYSIHDFDLTQYPAALDDLRDLYRADNPDLSRFSAAGGKAIMWQGWGDPGAVPGAAIGYYENVVEKIGGKKIADDFFRLFMIPGAGHCFETPHQSTERFDPLSALEAWVERGVPPDAIMAHQADAAGAPVRSRPLCPFPKAAEYAGAGDVNDGKHFHCVTP